MNQEQNIYVMDQSPHIQRQHQKFYDFWHENANDHGQVPADTFNPKSLIPLLSNLVKVKETAEGPQYTVIGTNVVEEYKQDFTNILIKDHPYPVCRDIYLNLIERMKHEQTLAVCFGQFCYPDRKYLRTMHSGFALYDSNQRITGYIILFTVDHSLYPQDIYAPVSPHEYGLKDAQISNQHDFDKTIETYNTFHV